MIHCASTWYLIDVDPCCFKQFDEQFHCGCKAHFFDDQVQQMNDDVTGMDVKPNLGRPQFHEARLTIHVLDLSLSTQYLDVIILHYIILHYIILYYIILYYIILG